MRYWFLSIFFRNNYNFNPMTRLVSLAADLYRRPFVEMTIDDVDKIRVAIHTFLAFLCHCHWNQAQLCCLFSFAAKTLVCLGVCFCRGGGGASY